MRADDATPLLAPHAVGQRPSGKHCALIFLAALACYLPLAAGSGLWDRDEAWYAQIAWEIRQRREWIVPYYLGEPAFVKPPLLFWLVAASMEAFGKSEPAVRVVPMVCLAATLVAIYRHGSRMHSRRLGALAAGIFGTTFIAACAGSMVLADGPLVLLTTLAMTAWIESLLGHPNRRRSLIFWVCLALAVLTKGPVVFLFVGPAMTLAWLWRRKSHPEDALRVFRCVHPAWGIPLLIVLSGWWYVLAAVRSPEAFTSRFVAYDLWARLVKPLEGHGGPPGYYLLATLALLLPWSPLVPGMIVQSWRRRRQDPWIAVLLAWLIAPWPLFEIIATKLPHYLLHAYPAFALLQARELLRLEQAGRAAFDRDRGARVGVVVWAMLVGWILAGAFGLALWAGAGELLLPVAVGATVWLVAGVLAARSTLNGRPVIGACCVIFAMVALFQIIGWWQLPALRPLQIGRTLALEARRLARPDDRFAVLGFDEPSVYYYLGKLPAIRKNASPPELDALLADGPLVILADQANVDVLSGWWADRAVAWRELRGWNLSRWRRDDRGRPSPEPVRLYYARVGGRSLGTHPPLQ